MAEPRLVGTSSLLLLSSGAERLSGLIVTVLIGRILGPEALGQYSLILTLWSVFAVLAYFGQAKQIARDIARSPDLAPKLLGTSSALSLMASIVAGALMIATSAGLGYPQIVLAGTAIAAASFLWADSQCVVTEAALISLRRVSAVAAINIVASAVRAVVSLAMLLWRIDVLAMLALIGATQIATAIALRVAAARAVTGHALRWDGEVARG